MKKLLLILAIAVAVVAKAQVATINIPDGSTAGVYTTSKTLTNTTEQWFQWNISAHQPTTQAFTCTLTEVTGACTNVALSLYGRIFSTEDWVLIGTVNSGALTTPYVLSISNVAHVRYRQFKCSFTGTGTHTTTITGQNFKFWKQ